MIQIIDANILSIEKGYIAHQVNHRGIMGAGLAQQIARKYPDVVEPYQAFCRKHSWELISTLGLVYFHCVNPSAPLFIANVFGQQAAGTAERQTDYSALFRGLYTVRAWAIYHKEPLPVAIPYGIGCGLGGGDWTYVYENIIMELFSDGDVELIICKI